MKRRIAGHRTFPIILFLILTLVLFYKVAFGLYPFAGNLLVSFFFPWSSGGFSGYNSWTTHKEFIGSDSIRMQLPWKVLAFDLIKKVKIPLWNPYTFSGNPLLANYQSGLFYPFNILYLIFHPLTAWTMLTILQVFLSMVFMFLLLRKFKVSKAASVLASFAFISSSFFITWIEIDIIGHTYLWLPLIVYSIESILVDKKRYFYPFISFFIALSIFAGYPQTAVLIILYSITYFLFRAWSLAKKKKPIVYFFFFLILGLGLAAVQLIPTYEFYQQAPLAKDFANWTFDHFLIPYRQLITFFAPDFFGNPAANNFWGQDYGDLTPSMGIIPLFLAFIPVLFKKKNKIFSFLYGTGLVFLFLTVKSPLSFIVKTLRLSILSSGTPARMLCLLFFNLAFLAGFGFDIFFNRLKKSVKNRRLILLISIFILIYILLWFFAFFGARAFPNNNFSAMNLAVTRRNLILPTLSFVAILGIFLLRKIKILPGAIKKQFYSLSKALVLIIVFLNLFYSLNKYNPFSPKKFFFPDHPVTEFLQSKTTAPDRFYGVDTAHFDDNFASFYKIYAAEGYDALRIGRYAELIAAIETGEIPKEYLRSDARFPNQDSENRRKIFNLLGIKYILDKDDVPTKGWDPQPWKYPEDRYKLIWQEEKFKVYESLEALPRVFLVNDYLVLKDKQEIIEKIFSADFDFSKTIILEEKISSHLKSNEENSGKAEFISYSPNQIVIKTKSNADSLLFLSDSYYPGWKAFIDKKETKIYRANYTFRAIGVPDGEHQITFSYQPFSFKFGFAISIISILVCIISLIKSLAFNKTVG
ncbi:YfhO family protein [Candidatus Microgenomates bacterium]|nr:YfhO family protein [Candidatus Microgenomates bacterium]